MITTLIHGWCCFWGFAAGVAAVVAVGRVIYDRGSIWVCRFRYRAGAARRQQLEQAHRILSSAIDGIDRRIFSRGIWKENHYMPAEDNAARQIIMDACHKVATEMYYT